MGTAAEIIVKPGDSIQSSINSAASGDTIIIKPGTYTENIKIIKDDLTIRSETGNPEDTIIKARSPTSHAFLLQADKIKINGLKISGASRFGYAGICLSSCNNCAIENNMLLSNSFGVYLLNSKGNIISKNTVSDSDRGIYFKFSKSNTLSGNKATGNGEYGIALESSDGNVLSENTAFKNERGIYFGSSDGNTVTSNTVQNNKIYGFSICGRCDKNIVYNNYFNDNNMIIKSGIGNAYNTEKKAGTNIVGGSYIGGNYWAKPNGTGFSQTAVDKNGDGISDSAYRITGSVYSDYLPLVITSKSPASEPKPPTSTLPVADFWGTPKSGNAPLDVKFTDISTGTPTEWKWDFGDGTTSTTRNPTHTYSTAGKYAVILIVRNGAGTNTLTKTNYINVGGTTAQKPVADFWGSPKSGNAPFDVTFNDISKGAPTAWKWDFGDGTYSTQKNPVHKYSKEGKFTVSLTIKNAAGNNSVTKHSYINVKI